MRQPLRKHILKCVLLFLVLLGLDPRLPAFSQQVPPGFTIEEVSGDLSRGSVGLALLPDGRILVIHHQSGRVELVVGDSLRMEPVLVLEDIVISSEQGLLGIAVDPDYPDSNYVYLFSTRSDSTNRVSRYTVEGQLEGATSFELNIDPSTERILFSAPDTTRFHNGGTLRFGRDKTLFMSFGDDAYAARVQSLENLNGKILRIHRDGSIPDDNPVYPGESQHRRGEIFAMGLRNPFRFSIDPLWDRLFIGDVGTNLNEELNIAEGGENFGYPRYEGPDFFRENEALIEPLPTFPAYDYPHSSRGRSVIALFTYRQKNFPDDASFPEAYEGAHFFTDYFSDELKYLVEDDTGQGQVLTFGSGFSQLVDAAHASDGSVYLVSYQGKLLRLSYGEPSNVASDDHSRSIADVMDQNYPNPLQGSTRISYSLSQPGQVRLDVFDLLGRKIRTLVDERQGPGRYSVQFDAASLPAGVYVYRIQTNAYSLSKKMIVTGR